MMTGDTYLTLTEAVALLPKKHGKKPHVKTLERWIRNGVRTSRAAGSPRIKLLARKVGWQWFTTREWLRDFEDACSEAARPAGRERTPARRRRDHAFAKRELIRRFGFHDDSKDKEAAAPEGLPGEVLNLRSTG